MQTKQILTQIPKSNKYNQSTQNINHIYCPFKKKKKFYAIRCLASTWFP